MNQARRFFLLAVAAPWVASACRGARSPLAPATLLSGAWEGTIADSVRGQGSVRLTIVQGGPGLAGTWSASFANGTAPDGGPLSGSVVGPMVSLFLSPSSSLACASGATLSGTLAATLTTAGDTLSGTYTAFTCDSVRSGTVDVRKT